MIRAKFRCAVDNPAARLEVGKFYYLDFTEVPAES